MIIFNKATCPNCGGPLRINKEDGIANCNCCGTDFILEITNSQHKIKALDNKPDKQAVVKPKLKLYISDNICLNILIILSILTIIAASILIGVFYDGYELRTENNIVICSDIHKCVYNYNNITYTYKIKNSTNISTDTYNVYFNSYNYMLQVNRVLAKDGDIYLNELPIYILSNNNCYFISIGLANEGQVISGIVMLIIGVIALGFLIFISR